jgi:hypothetical protein
MHVLLFSHDAAYSAAAIAGGVARVIVDWESDGKFERQAGRDTEVNRGTLADLVAAVAVAGDRVACRINNTAAGREVECDLAVEHGAGEVWLPMVRDIAEVEQCLRRLDGRASLGVLVETRAALALGRELQALPLARVYVGLNDLRIDRGHARLFDPIVDGTLDRFRETYAGPFGFAGITVPTAGRPVPQRWLLAAMMRLGCTFGVARRAFRADVPAAQVGMALAQIDEHARALAARSPTQVVADQQELARVLRDLPATAPMPVATGLACAP